MTTDEFLDEVENLKGIYEDAVHVDGSLVTREIKPCEDELDCFVCVTLRVSIPDTYPEAAAQPTLANVRGLTSKHAKELEKKLVELCEEYASYPDVVLFTLFDEAELFLQEHNLPSTTCAVCLEAIDVDTPAGDPHSLVKTPCYHFFHHNCLARHFFYWRTDPQVDLSAEMYRQARARTKSDEEAHHLIRAEKAAEAVPCPVCRCGIEDADVPTLSYDHLPPYDASDIDRDEVHVSRRVKREQQKREQIRQRQQDNHSFVTPSPASVATSS